MMKYNADNGWYPRVIDLHTGQVLADGNPSAEEATSQITWEYWQKLSLVAEHDSGGWIEWVDDSNQHWSYLLPVEVCSGQIFVLDLAYMAWSRPTLAPTYSPTLMPTQLPTFRPTSVPSVQTQPSLIESVDAPLPGEKG